jgi:hypothetical protein|nr:MAG TPA_asm: hypothetical protein [Caudoviricetes sp.]
MTDKELEEKNRFTEEEYKKKVKEQFNQMLEDDSKKEQELIMKKLRKKQNASLRKLKRMVQIKKETDEFVKKLKEQEQ